jgi:hypothetical protein
MADLFLLSHARDPVKRGTDERLQGRSVDAVSLAPTGSKTCSDGTKIGGASIPAPTAALIPTSRQSPSPQSSSLGSDQALLSLAVKRTNVAPCLPG